MSRAIPPQWDKYGYTFWIPTHVEPTVAIIGSALPALRNHFKFHIQKLSSAMSSGKTSSSSGQGSRRTGGSGGGDTKAPSSGSQGLYTRMAGGSIASSRKESVELVAVRYV